MALSVGIFLLALAAFALKSSFANGFHFGLFSLSLALLFAGLIQFIVGFARLRAKRLQRRALKDGL